MTSGTVDADTPTAIYTLSLAQPQLVSLVFRCQERAGKSDGKSMNKET